MLPDGGVVLYIHGPDICCLRRKVQLLAKVCPTLAKGKGASQSINWQNPSSRAFENFVFNSLVSFTYLYSWVILSQPYVSNVIHCCRYACEGWAFCKILRKWQGAGKEVKSINARGLLDISECLEICLRSGLQAKESSLAITWLLGIARNRNPTLIDDPLSFSIVWGILLALHKILLRIYNFVTEYDKLGLTTKWAEITANIAKGSHS